MKQNISGAVKDFSLGELGLMRPSSMHNVEASWLRAQFKCFGIAGTSLG